LEKFKISYKAALILVLAFVVAFLATVFLLVIVPRFRVNETDRVRLLTENQTLQSENKDIALKIHKLNTQMSRVEENSQRVVALMQTD
jgi:cell division protein FtsB